MEDLKLRKTASLPQYEQVSKNTLVKAVLSTREIDPLIAPQKSALPTPEAFMQKALEEIQITAEKLGYFPPVSPPNEADRQKALDRFGVVDTSPEASYDNLVHLASEMCEAPIALVSLLDNDRQWFKARVGLGAQETHRDISFCGHAINTPDALFIVEDATQDQRFKGNPLVTGDPNIRFYAGQPLVTHDGFPLGTLCVIDTKPRKLTEQQRSSLLRLSKQVITELELRLALEQLRTQMDITDKLLLNVLPEKIIRRLKEDPTAAIADSHPDVSVLFADIVGFTTFCTKNTAQAVVEDLGAVFSLFDKLCEKYNVYKVKTIGDGYMISAGIPDAQDDHALRAVNVGFEMLHAVSEFNKAHGKNFQIRVGINSGPVYAGIIGSVRFSYDLWGNTVNIASRIESNGSAGQICVSESTYALVKDKFPSISSRSVQLKGTQSVSQVICLGPKVHFATNPEESHHLTIHNDSHAGLLEDANGSGSTPNASNNNSKLTNGNEKPTNTNNANNNKNTNTTTKQNVKTGWKFIPTSTHKGSPPPKKLTTSKSSNTKNPTPTPNTSTTTTTTTTNSKAQQINTTPKASPKATPPSTKPTTSPKTTTPTQTQTQTQTTTPNTKSTTPHKSPLSLFAKKTNSEVKFGNLNLNGSPKPRPSPSKQSVGFGVGSPKQGISPKKLSSPKPTTPSQKNSTPTNNTTSTDNNNTNNNINNPTTPSKTYDVVGMREKTEQTDSKEDRRPRKSVSFGNVEELSPSPSSSPTPPHQSKQ